MKTLPTTIAEAATYMLTQLNDSQKAELRAMPEDALWQCHFGLGMGIRNTLKLWDPKHPIHGGELFFDADDCSMEIVKVMWEKLQRSDASLSKDCLL